MPTLTHFCTDRHLHPTHPWYNQTHTRLSVCMYVSYFDLTDYLQHHRATALGTEAKICMHTNICMGSILFWYYCWGLQNKGMPYDGDAKHTILGDHGAAGLKKDRHFIPKHTTMMHCQICKVQQADHNQHNTYSWGQSGYRVNELLARTLTEPYMAHISVNF